MSQSQLTSKNNVYVFKNLFENDDCSVETSIFNSKSNIISFEHKWILENLVSLYKAGSQAAHDQNILNENNNKIKLPFIKTTFCPTNLQATHRKVQFTLFCYPFGTDEKNDEHIAIFFELDNKFTLPSATVQYKFSILDKNGKKFYTKGNK